MLLLLLAEADSTAADPTVEMQLAERMKVPLDQLFAFIPLPLQQYSHSNQSTMMMTTTDFLRFLHSASTLASADHPRWSGPTLSRMGKPLIDTAAAVDGSEERKCYLRCWPFVERPIYPPFAFFQCFHFTLTCHHRPACLLSERC